MEFDERSQGIITMLVGAVIGILFSVWVYRKEGVRQWADGVAAELSKVVWPTKDVVTYGTFIVIATSFIATVYIAVLDRFWSFVTTVVYGV